MQRVLSVLSSVEIELAICNGCVVSLSKSLSLLNIGREKNNRFFVLELSQVPKVCEKCID